MGGLLEEQVSQEPRVIFNRNYNGNVIMKYDWDLYDKTIARTVAYGEAETLDEAKRACEAAQEREQCLRCRMTVFLGDDLVSTRFRTTKWTEEATRCL